MKYRIKEVNGRFYPQYKWLCFWINFTEYYYDDQITVKRWTLIDACRFLDAHLAGLERLAYYKTRSNKTKIHEYNNLT